MGRLGQNPSGGPHVSIGAGAQPLLRSGVSIVRDSACRLVRTNPLLLWLHPFALVISCHFYPSAAGQDYPSAAAQEPQFFSYFPAFSAVKPRVMTRDGGFHSYIGYPSFFILTVDISAPFLEIR